jgi:NitT/TauT family transport system substrate-binding protein
MMTDRRTFLQGAMAAAAWALTHRLPPAEAQGLRTVRFGFGLKSISPMGINILIGESLGYNKTEGFQLDVKSLGTNGNVQIAIDKGDIDFGVGVLSFQLPMYAKGELPPVVNFYEYTYPYKWDVAVKPGSPIKRYEDLKGKKIGVSDLGATDYPVTRSVLRNLGIDPEKDVTWIAVGQGTPAGVALERGAIDALAYFDAGFGQIEAAGIPLTYLPRPTNIPQIGGQFIMAKKDFLKANRQLAVGLGRSTAKASEFILANPEAGAKVFLRLYPEVAPKGKGEADAVAAVLTTIARRITLFRPYDKSKKMGYVLESEILADAKFAGLDSIKDVKPLYTNELIDEMHNFDVEKIRAEAKTYK